MSRKKNKQLSILLVTVMMIVLVMSFSMTSVVAESNMAIGCPTTVSSTYYYLYPGSSAVDGNVYSMWQSNYSSPQWIYVDLGSARDISRVVLNWAWSYGNAYKIQTSSDAANWTDIYSTTTGNGGIDDLSGLSGNARYVRLYCTESPVGQGYTLYEFEIYGEGGGTPTPTPTSTPTPTPTSTPTPPPGSGYTKIVNCGGNAVDGAEADQAYTSGSWGYAGGSPYSVSDTITPNCGYPTAMKSVRYQGGTLTYNFAVPNDTYTVKLDFAEIFYTAAGQRQFDIKIEGATKATNYDIFSQTGGHDKGKTETYSTTVSDGILQIDFVSKIDCAMVNVIEVYGSGSGATPTPTPTPTPTSTPPAGVPPAAAGAGYNRLSFNDDFNSLSTIDVNGSGNAGYNWYIDGPIWNQGNDTPQSCYSISNGVLDLTGPRSQGWALSTFSVRGNTGSSFRFGYFEARIHFDPTQGATSSWFPCFWSLSTKHSRINNSDHWAELDFFEAYTGGYNNYSGAFVGTLHDWANSSLTHYQNSNNWTPTSVDWNQWQLLGCLWTPGSVSWYLNNNLLQTVTYSANGYANPPSWGPIGCFNILDTDPEGIQLILGNCPEWHMYVDWVKVYQQ